MPARPASFAWVPLPLLLALASPAPAGAQGARPSGDRRSTATVPARPTRAPRPAADFTGTPPAGSDSIYRLAVNPAEFPEERAAFLLDDGEVRVEGDGRRVETFRQVVQLLQPAAVDGYREQSFSYAPKHERLTINWMRVVRPDGKVVSLKPTQVQDSDVPAELGDPVYSDRRVRRVSLTGVDSGTIVDVSWTREELKPFLPGDFLLSWAVNTGLQVRRSRYVVNVPTSLPVRIEERNLPFARGTATAGGRTVHTWAAKDLPRVKAEAFASDSNEVYQSVLIASPLTWEDIGRWYAGHARDRYVATPAVQAKLREVIAGARTRDDTLRAVHRWVAQDVRYVSIALGLGGYQPRTPDEVLRTGFGDCKDKATLFVTALQKLGYTAYPVLLNSTGGVRRNLPSLQQLDHAIAAVQLDGGWRYVDLTAEFTPWGELPASEQGAFAMIVRPDGATEVVTLPEDPVTANAATTRLIGELSEDGTFTGRYEEETRGSRQYGLRSAFEHEPDSATVTRASNALAARFVQGAEGDSLRWSPGKDLATQPRMSLRIRNGRMARASGATQILTLPFSGMASLENLAKELEREPVRRMPIDVEQVLGAHTALTEFRVKLPTGWTAQLPSRVEASSVFGSYVSEYAMEGDELRVTRRTTGARGWQPPSEVKALTAWLRAVAKDDATFLVLTKK